VKAAVSICLCAVIVSYSPLLYYRDFRAHSPRTFLRVLRVLLPDDFTFAAASSRIPHLTMAAADTETSEPEYFDVKRVSISPNMCPVSSPVRFSAVLTSTQNITSAHWEFSWLLDSTRRRYIIVLGKTDTKDYPAGSLEFDFQVSEIFQVATSTNGGL
jgi:hypothetical protein